jgi:hypothetical protein
MIDLKQRQEETSVDGVQQNFNHVMERLLDTFMPYVVNEFSCANFMLPIFMLHAVMNSKYNYNKLHTYCSYILYFIYMFVMMRDR